MKKIVTIGGGTGSYTILSGVKYLKDVDITALVSMADDGGSTGVLRDELGVLPPGDVRQCLVALSEHTPVVRSLMGYRFSEGSLAGHSFGNILLAALEKVTGDFAYGVEIASEILRVRGKVIPITKNKAELVVTLLNGKKIFGEDVLNHSDIQSSGIAGMGYKEKVEISSHAKQAILEADYVIIGPGNYYCSVLPNIMVEGCREVLQQTKAKIIFPVNLTNKHGHTLGWGVQEYVDNIETQMGRVVDYVLVNNKAPSEEQVEYYKMEEGDGVLVHDNSQHQNIVREELLSQAVVKPVEGDTLSSLRSFIRHDSEKVAQVIDMILRRL